VAGGRKDLDKPISLYLPSFRGPTADQISVRQLLRHQSGLPNPSDMPDGATGVPDFYKRGHQGDHSPVTGFCAGKPAGLPGDRWSYNNCDYMVAGALLEHVTGKPWTKLVAERITRPLGMKSVRAFPRREPTVAGFEDGKPEAPQDLTAYQASAALSGTINDLWKFDRALMTGKLLPATQRAEMWDGQPKLGSIALGQWVFKSALRGCPSPVLIVERRGQIGGVEVRNFILPGRDVVAIAFVNRDGFEFGEVWQGKGFSYDLLSAAACS
jgi:CubicO group peptidase (beta-lactamase class C family)